MPTLVASAGGPDADIRTDSPPSWERAIALTHSSSPSSPSTTSARAPTGAEQPPSRVARTARSASTAAPGPQVLEIGQPGRQVDVAGAALDRQRTLPGGGEHLQRVEHLGDLVEPSEPGQPGPGQYDGVVLTGPDLADPGVHVAPDVDDIQTEAERVELGDPPRRAGADAGTGRQLAEREPVAGHDDVARVLAWRHGGERDPVARAGGQVLEGVDGQVDPAVEQGVAQRADEDAGPADLGERAHWWCRPRS